MYVYMYVCVHVDTYVYVYVCVPMYTCVFNQILLQNSRRTLHGISLPSSDNLLPDCGIGDLISSNCLQNTAYFSEVSVVSLFLHAQQNQNQLHLAF